MAVCQNCSNKEDLKSHLGATLFFAAYEHSTMGHCVVAMNKLAQLRPRFLTEEKLTIWVKNHPKMSHLNFRAKKLIGSLISSMCLEF